MRFTGSAKTAVAGLALAALVASGAGATTAWADEGTEPPAETTACRFGTWPGADQGQPAGFQAGAAGGVYLWHTDSGWRLRLTHPGSEKVVFRGTITSASRIHGVARRTESRDVVVSPGTHRVGFRFTNYGHVDGVDFRMACGTGFAVNVTVNGRPLPADHVFLGADAHHPARVPFRIERHTGA